MARRWFLDRSRYERGLDYCPRARYLEYHAGPTGYGFRRKAQSMPLLLGSVVHEALATILRAVQAQDQLPDEITVRKAIAEQVQAYQQKITQHGLSVVGELDPFHVERLLKEQTALLTGLVWGWVTHVLPWLHQRSKVIEVEREETLVVGCDCGVAPGPVESHPDTCEGLVIQGRADFLTESRHSPGSYAYEEFKTTSMFGMWFDAWETKLQFALGMMAAEARLGVEIHEHYVHGLAKGRRMRETDPTGQELSTRYQSSPYCYGFCRPGTPPLEPDDWKPEYRWKDEWGKGHQVSKQHRRRGVWEYGPVPEGIDPVEYYARSLPDEVARKQFQVLGPYNRQRVMIEMLRRQVVAHEESWIHRLGVLYEIARGVQAHAGSYWADPRFQAALDHHIPCSWACRRYGAEHPCQFEPVCFRQAGWEDPLAAGYVLRRPHHQAELEQMRAEGLEPVDDLGEVEEDA